jgi:hypothetical protein
MSVKRNVSVSMGESYEGIQLPAETRAAALGIAPDQEEVWTRQGNLRRSRLRSVPAGAMDAAIENLSSIRGRSLPFVTVRESLMIRRGRSPSFATVRVGRICKQGVVIRVLSSPLVVEITTIHLMSGLF